MSGGGESPGGNCHRTCTETVRIVLQSRGALTRARVQITMLRFHDTPERRGLLRRSHDRCGSPFFLRTIIQFHRGHGFPGQIQTLRCFSMPRTFGTRIRRDVLVDLRIGVKMKCPSCKSDFFPWRPCCYAMGDKGKREALLKRAGLLGVSGGKK